MDSLINFSLCIDLCDPHPDKAMEPFQCTRRLPGAMMRQVETIGLKKNRKEECLPSFFKNISFCIYFWLFWVFVAAWTTL